MTETIGLFVHYRPVVLALPAGGCQAVAGYLEFNNPDKVQQALDSAGLLYRHPVLGPAVTSLLHVEPAETTLEAVLHQSLMPPGDLNKRRHLYWHWGNPRRDKTLKLAALDFLSFGTSLHLYLPGEYLLGLYPQAREGCLPLMPLSFRQR